jgi:hypothetical protein
MGKRGNEVEENRKLVIAALVVILGGNASNIVGAVDPSIKVSAFSTLDAAKLEARIMAHIQNKCEENESQHNSFDIRLSVAEFQIKDCVRKVGP